MDTKELVLAALSTAGGEKLTPVQVQKLFFLIDRNISDLVGGAKFQFKPYHYGPFDSAVYRTLDKLVREGLAERVQDVSWTSFRLTVDGQREGKRHFDEMDPKAADYIRRVSEFVRTRSFGALVSAIYQAYPDMSEKSVFRGSPA